MENWILIFNFPLEIEPKALADKCSTTEHAFAMTQDRKPRPMNVSTVKQHSVYQRRPEVKRKAELERKWRSGSRRPAQPAPARAPPPRR